jgi:hypothetical protein
MKPLPTSLPPSPGVCPPVPSLLILLPLARALVILSNLSV